MKKRLPVPPTKSALLQVGRQARFLEQGRQMLEKKRDLLTRLVYERLAQYRELRAQTQRELAAAYRWLQSDRRLAQHLLAHAHLHDTEPAVAIKVVARSSVGVEYPSVSAE